MIQTGKFNEAVERKIDTHPHFRGTILGMLAGKSRSGISPQAYLVHQQPDWEFIPHFHLEEQFQVFVEGEGSIGRHALAPVAIHYASRETGYGPLIAGKQGLSYFTLRAVSDDGLWPLPEKKTIMQAGMPKKQLTVENVQDAPAGPGELKPLIDGESGGLAAWLVKLDGTVSCPQVDHSVGGGTFYLVLEGSVTHDGQQYDKYSCLFVSPDEAGLELESGNASVLILRFPESALSGRVYPEERYQVA